jgi:hypothetical protein
VQKKENTLTTSKKRRKSSNGRRIVSRYSQHAHGPSRNWCSWLLASRNQIAADLSCMPVKTGLFLLRFATSCSRFKGRGRCPAGSNTTTTLSVKRECQQNERNSRDIVEDKCGKGKGEQNCYPILAAFPIFWHPVLCEWPVAY